MSQFTPHQQQALTVVAEWLRSKPGSNGAPQVSHRTITSAMMPVVDVLRYVAFSDRPDYASVAQALGMPVGSIGPTRGRCLAKLRLLLDADPHWGIS